MFAEPVHYTRAGCPAGWKILDWETANKLLGYLDSDRRPFAAFTFSDNSYVQCFGAKKRLIIEAREFRKDGSFTHWVFGRGCPIGKNEHIAASTGSVTADVTQLLTMRDARIIIRQFLETRTFPAAYFRQDVTIRF